jgi:DNA-binding NarL/FixJ family response regulator
MTAAFVAPHGDVMHAGQGGRTAQTLPPASLVAPVPQVGVVIVQAHRVLRDALQLRLEQEPDLAVLGSVALAADSTDVLRGSPNAVVVLDEPDSVDGLHHALGELRTAAPDSRVLLLMRTAEPAKVTAAIQAGVSGLLSCDAPPESLAQAVRTIASGACVLDQAALSHLAGQWAQFTQPVLSVREREVLSLVATGLSNAEIASQLYVSTETVKTHVAHLLRKLEVPNRASAVEKATQLGLLV